MKKILIVTYDMLPHAKTWGGCQRMYYLAKRLEKLDFQVDIAALRVADYNDYGKDLPRGTRFLSPKATVSKKPGESSGIKSDFQPSRSAISALKQMVKRGIFEFDKVWFNEIKKGDGILTFRNFIHAKKELKKILKGSNYDIAICSGPPFNVFRAIPLIKKYCPDTRVIMDYRDPWNSWHEGNAFTSRREAKYEKMADLIVCTNEALCRDLSDRFRTSPDKFMVVANGYTGEPYCPQSPPDNSKLQITYTGAISFTESHSEYRDTTALIDAIRHFKLNNVKEFKLIFVGASNNDESYVSRLKSELGEMIEILPPVSADKANEYIRESDICLLMHTSEDNSGKFLVSGKAYDYIRDRKFILSIGRHDNQHACLVKDLGIGINALNTKEDIIRALNQCLEMHRNHSLHSVYDGVDVASFSRNNQIDKYIKIIENL